MSAQQNNAMRPVYAPSPFNNPVSPPHPAAASHNAANVWYQPPDRVSQLSSVGPSNVMNQPHNGHAVPNIGIHFPNNVTGWGSNPSHNIPTSQAPSTPGVPAYNFDLAPNQRGTFQSGQAQHGNVQQGHLQHGHLQHQVQHQQVQHGNARHGMMQQRQVKRRKVKHETGQHASGSNIQGPNQPSAGTPRVNTPAAPFDPAQGPGNHDIEAIRAEFLRTVDPRSARFGPGDVVDMVWLQWYLGQPQQGQAMVPVRAMSLNTQEFEAGNLTLMNHSTQVQPATRPELPAAKSQMVRCLPTPHSPRRRSTITLPSSGPGSLKLRSHSTSNMV